MSRSAVQDAILSHLEDQSVERQKLLWDVARQLDRIPPPEAVGGGHKDARLPIAFKKSFDRALSRLKELGALTSQDWTPSSFPEFIDAYRFRTDSTLVQEMRARLLPKLFRTLKHGPATRISVEDVELRHVRTAISETSLELARSRWRELRTHIAQARLPPHEFVPLASVTIAAERLLHPPDWAKVVATGNFSGEWSGVSLSHSITELGQVATTRTGKSLASDLQSFYDKLIPAAVLKRGDLKNALYEFISVERYGTSSMKNETFWTLHRIDTDYVESLPGHHGPVPTLSQFPNKLPTYSPYLAHLLDRIALRKFKMVSKLAG